MPRKRKLKIPKSAMVKCPKCSKRSRVKVLENDCLYSHECKNKKCSHKFETPTAQCCIICAYSNKQCGPQLKRAFKG